MVSTKLKPKKTIIVDNYLNGVFMYSTRVTEYEACNAGYSLAQGYQLSQSC